MHLNYLTKILYDINFVTEHYSMKILENSKI